MVEEGENFTAPPKGEFEVAEEGLPARLGVSREVLRTLRQLLLVEGTHWRLVKKRVWLSEEGVRLLESGFGRLKNATAATLREGAVTAPSPGIKNEERVVHIEAGSGWAAIKTAGPEVVECVVLPSARITNPQMLLARTPQGKAVLVRVHSRVYWRAGMVIRCRKTAAGAAVYERVGRDPRFEGEKINQGRNSV